MDVHKNFGAELKEDLTRAHHATVAVWENTVSLTTRLNQKSAALLCCAPPKPEEVKTLKDREED